MDTEKRKIIIREIEHWRESRLLPEQYCDFLLNLYSEDAVAAQPDRSAQNRFLHGKTKRILYIIPFLAIIVILSYYFTAFPLPLQIGIAVFAIAICHAAGWRLRDRKPAAAVAVLGLGSLLMLVSGPLLLWLYGKTAPLYIGGYIVFCCLLWAAVGIALRLATFHFCGWVGLNLVCAWVLYQYGGDWAWWAVQAVWIPFSFLLAWLAWAIRHISVSSSRVLFSVSVLQWFFPDIVLWILNTSGSYSLWIAAAKLLIAGLAAVLPVHKRTAAAQQGEQTGQAAVKS